MTELFAQVHSLASFLSWSWVSQQCVSSHMAHLCAVLYTRTACIGSFSIGFPIEK